jgi:hypothetical protein
LGETVTAVDEDGSAYDATVESILADSRIYLRVNWITRSYPDQRYEVSFGAPSWKLPARTSAIAQ